MGKGFAAVLWDVDVETFDVERHAGFLVRRVLERGGWREWVLLRDTLGLERIEELAVKLPRLDPRAHAFCAAIFRRPLESFACYGARSSSTVPWRS